MNEPRWTVWVFAGPGAFDGLGFEGADIRAHAGPRGEFLSLAARVAKLRGDVAKLPVGVKLVAESISSPTLLQQLTGEWPARRLVGESGATIEVVPAPAERDLAAFLAWAASQTPASSRRALVVLGDVLAAIGEAPKPTPPGSYRPTFPTTIRVRKGTSWTSYTKNAADNDYRVSPTSPSVTLVSIGKSLVQDDQVNFDESKSYYQYQASSANYQVVDSLGARVLDKDRQPLGNATIAWATDGVSVTEAALRGFDELGPVDVDAPTRRVGALAEVLAKHRVDVLASDQIELTRLVALRLLAGPARLLVGPARERLVAGQPLVTMLNALNTKPDLEPEALCTAIVDGYQTSTTKLREAAERLPALRGAISVDHDIVALRSEGGLALLAALDSLARQAVTAGKDSTLQATLASAYQGGVDLTQLLAPLAPIDEWRHAGIRTALAATVLARRKIGTNPDERSGIALDAGLQLAPSCEWTRLHDILQGLAKADVVRRTIADMRAASVRPRRRLTSGMPLRWLEYDPSPVIDFDPRADFEAFLARELAAASAARHLALIVRGKHKSSSIELRSGGVLSLGTLTSCLQQSLTKQRRAMLAIIVLEGAELLSLEHAYELSEVACTFLTNIQGTALPTRALFESRFNDVLVRACEREAADALPASASLAALMQPWCLDVARRLASHVVAPDHDRDGIIDELDTDDDNDGQLDQHDADDDGDGILDHQELAGVIAMQGIDLRHIGSLCRRLDRILQLMFGELADPAVLEAVKAAASASSLSDLLSRARVQSLTTSKSALVREIHNALGDLYRWITVSKHSVTQGGAPFWIDPRFVEDANPTGYCARLRINTAAIQPRDYRELEFHRDVRLQGLLMVGRLLDPTTQRMWSMISLGLDYAPEAERHRRLAALTGDVNAAHYFASLDTPPTLSFQLEEAALERGYELRLMSSESAAVLVRQTSRVDIEAVDRALEGLGYIGSNSVASREGWSYLESLGASLAEDIVNRLREPLEQQRALLLARSGSDDAHLSLVLPRELMRYPWELMRLPPQRPGEPGELLAERFVVGRQMWSERELRFVRRDERLRMLIVADPRTSLAGLPGARAEAKAIQDLCTDMSKELGRGFTFECDVSVGQHLSRALLRQRIRDGNYDVVHFAGHGSFDEAQPDRSGWMLSDGLLSTIELANTLNWSEHPPWLIYANTCSGGRFAGDPAAFYQGQVHGMADACIRAGVSNFIAPLWRVHDETARMLATEFYRRLLLERSTIGVSLHRARIQARKTWESLRGDEGLGDISWAGVVLFGNPVARISDCAG